MIPCNAACVWHFQQHISLHPSSSFIPTTSSNTPLPNTHTPLLSSISQVQTALPYVPHWRGEGRKASWQGHPYTLLNLPRQDAGTDKKNNTNLPNHDQGSATLYLQRQNKGRPVEHSDCVYFWGETMTLRGGGKDLCVTWGPLWKKCTSFWFTVSLTKQL